MFTSPLRARRKQQLHCIVCRETVVYTNTNQNDKTENICYFSAFKQTVPVFTRASMVKFRFAKSKLRFMNTTGVKLDSEHTFSRTHIWETVITLHLKTDSKKNIFTKGNVLLFHTKLANILLGCCWWLLGRCYEVFWLVIKVLCRCGGVLVGALVA